MSEREGGPSERGSSYRCMHKRGFDWANIITWNEIKTVNESLFHSISPSVLSLLSPIFFIMRIPNLFHFIIAPPPSPPRPPPPRPPRPPSQKCHMYENHASIRQQICHDFCHIHSVYKSHYGWQRGYLHIVSHLSLSLTAINTARRFCH